MILEHLIRTLGDGKSLFALSRWERVNSAVSCSIIPEDFDVPESRTVI
jgi:hypothetical protein